MNAPKIPPLKLILGCVIWITLFQFLPFYFVLSCYVKFVWPLVIFALMDAPHSVLVAAITIPFFVLTVATLLLSHWLGLIIVRRFLTRDEMRGWLIGSRPRPVGIKMSEWLLERLYK
jgi:hypothetical protein